MCSAELIERTEGSRPLLRRHGDHQANTTILNVPIRSATIRSKLFQNICPTNFILKLMAQKQTSLNEGLIKIKVNFLCVIFSTSDYASLCDILDQLTKVNKRYCPSNNGIKRLIYVDCLWGHFLMKYKLIIGYWL